MSETLYQDASGRLPVYALQAQLQIQIFSKARTLEKYGFSSYSQQSWFVFQILCYLMRRTLEVDETDGCSLDEIGWEIQEIIKTQYDFTLDPSQCQELANTVIIEILCNNGVPITFSTDTIRNEEVPLVFLHSPEVVRHGEHIGVYRMADDGFRLMLGTREMEENMKVSLSSIIIQMHMDAHNYKGALQEAREQIDRLRIQESRIRDSILQIRNDVLSISLQDTQTMFEENLKTFENARKKFSDIRINLGRIIMDARAELEAGSLSEDTYEQLGVMNEIDEHLQYSITVMGRIIDALSEFLRTRRNEYLLQMGVSAMRTRSIQKDVYEPVLKHPDLLVRLEDFFKPLFSRKPDGMFQPERFLEIRQYQKEEEEEEAGYSQEDPENLAQERLEARLRDVEQMHAVFAAFMKLLLARPDHSLDLHDFRTLCDALEELEDSRLLKELLASWSMVKSVDLEDLFGQEAELDPASETLYSVPLSCLAAARTLPELREYSRLILDRAEGQETFAYVEDRQPMQLQMDNLKMKLERKLL